MDILQDYPVSIFGGGIDGSFGNNFLTLPQRDVVEISLV
jgi:hypothetical protein